jgi:hypothetical protein
METCCIGQVPSELSQRAQFQQIWARYLLGQLQLNPTLLLRSGG